MVTLLIGTLSAAEWQQILGLILTGFEVLLVVIGFLQILVNPESKFGKFLKKLLKGITFVKGEFEKMTDEDKKDKTEK